MGISLRGKKIAASDRSSICINSLKTKPEPQKVTEDKLSFLANENFFIKLPTNPVDLAINIRSFF